MTAKLKSSVFIDTLTFELSEAASFLLKAVLKDEKGAECSRLETDVEPSQKEIRWHGLNDLPYGIYQLELTGGELDQRMRLVKRV